MSDFTRKDAGMVSVPLKWSETEPRIKDAISRYKLDQTLRRDEVAAIREHILQWISNDVWNNAGVGIELLRADAERIRTQCDIDEWLRLADDAGITPLA